MNFIYGLGLIILAYIALSALLAIPVMLLWSWLVTDIFGLRDINIVEAWGLMFLSGMLFKSSYLSK